MIQYLTCPTTSLTSCLIKSQVCLRKVKLIYLSNNDNNDSVFDMSDDEFDFMSDKKPSLFKKSEVNIFKQNDNPVDSFIIDDSDDNISQEELLQSMIPVSLKDEMNPKLNIDGFIDSSDEEDSKNSKKRKQPKRKAYISDSSEDESSNREKKKTKKASV